MDFTPEPGGDLYVVLTVQESEVFKRDDQDLIVDVCIGISQAALGCKLRVPTPGGEQIIDVSPGTQHGHRVTIRGMGVPKIRGIGKGDLHVDIGIQVPKS